MPVPVKQNLKILPHNLEAEQALIGAMLLNPSIIPKVKSRLSPQDFYREANILIVDAIFHLDKKANPVTVKETLGDNYERAGGFGYLAHIVQTVTTSASFEYHSDVIKMLSSRRALINICSHAIDSAYGPTDINDYLSELKNQIRELQSTNGVDYRNNRDLVKSVFRDVEQRSQGRHHFVGIRTGFENIDSCCYGLEPKTTTYLIARPSMGKTALALNIADHVAFTEGNVLFFSLESGDEALTRRRLASDSGVYLSRIRTGDIEDSQWPFLIQSANKLSENNLLIISHPKYKTVENLTSMAETMAMESPISLIVIDHIQRMRTRKKTQSRHLELSYISEELSSLAINLKVPIIILCQLRRSIGEDKPRLDSMKESGDLEQNADMVWGLWRKTKEDKMTRLECLKGRDTGTWLTWLEFDRFIQRFKDGDPNYEENMEELF